MMTLKQIQTMLKTQGFDPGPIDGLIGRRTIAAVKAFQIQNPPLVVDGIPGPRTIAVLFKGHSELVTEPVDKLLSYPWLDLAITKKGLNEHNDNAELRKFLKSDGGTIGDPAMIPWCGDFVETCIALTLPNENLPTNPYLARNWERFGQQVKPTFAAVGAFYRGDRDHGIQGHVAFLVGQAKGLFYILGGNQSNSVSITSIAQDRLLSARWPLSVALPTAIKLPSMIGGKLSINEA